MLLANSVPNLTETDFEELQAIKEHMEGVSEVDDFLPLNRQFHFTAFSGHRAPQLAQIADRLWDTTESYRREYASLALHDSERLEVMRAERDLLLGAICRREMGLAPWILAIHIERAHLYVLQSSRLAIDH